MRIRSIRPEFWSSEDIARLSWDTRLVFIGLWSYVDDNGVGRDVEQLITAALFALEDSFTESSVRVHGALKQLQAGGQISRYEVDGKPYLHVTKFSTHQKINRPSGDRYPLPTSENAVLTERLTEPSLSPHADSPLGEGEKGRRGEGEKADARKRATPAPDTLEITDAMTTWATEKAAGVDLEAETARFLDHHRAKGSTFKDWIAAWRTWMSRSASYGNVRQFPKQSSENSREGMTRQIQVPGGRWREVYDDEIIYGKHTEWRPAL